MASFRNSSGRAQAWLNPALFSTSSSVHRDSAPSQDERQSWGFHSKPRQNLLRKYRNLLTMGLTCQLSFHCLIYASRECLGKSFKLQFTSKPRLAQSLGLGECFLLPIVKGVMKQKHCLESGVLGGHGRGAQGRPWALCPCWVALGRALPGHRAFALSYRDFSFSQPATLAANRDKGQQFRYSCV